MLSDAASAPGTYTRATRATRTPPVQVGETRSPRRPAELVLDVQTGHIERLFDRAIRSVILERHSAQLARGVRMLLRREPHMARRSSLLALGLLCFSCGGHAGIDSPSGGSTGGTAVMGGTVGTVGTSGEDNCICDLRAGGGGGAAGAAGVGGSGSSGTGGIDWAACAPPDSCVLETQTDCGGGCEPVPLSAFIPANSKNDAAYKMQHESLCPGGGDQCPAVPPDSVNTKNYYAACEAGRCQPIDVRTSSLSECSINSECYLRSGTSCCGCGSDWTAVSSRVDAGAAFCGSSACAADCVSAAVPPGVSAVCGHSAGASSGHCLVQYP